MAATGFATNIEGFVGRKDERFGLIEFRHRPSVSRSLSLEEMDQAIADAFSADADPASVWSCGRLIPVERLGVKAQG